MLANPLPNSPSCEELPLKAVRCRVGEHFPLQEPKYLNFFAGKKETQAMATLLPNLNLFSSQSLTDSRNLLSHRSYRPALTINSGKPIWAATISSHRLRECRISVASQRRSRTVSTSAAFVSDEDEEEEEEEDEEEGEEFIPFREMTRWLQNKPAGFGEAKKYDTTVEDKLLEEMKRNRKDQLEENSKPRARENVNEGSVKKEQKHEVTKVIKTDSEVRVWNLPKKKNIERDLWKAFKGFPGIISINPAVTGNKKTRDPICRGFAFIGFESDDAAYGFAQKYSNQNLLFGKAQKQISCDVIKANGVPNSSESSRSCSSNSSNTSELRRSADEICLSNPSDISKSANDIEPNREEFSVLPNDRNVLSSNNENGVNEDLQFSTPMAAHQNRKKIAKRDRTKPPKSTKLHILGSLAKLKNKDRAVLTGVFSKYGEVASAVSKEI